jgi:hypothetical protein
MKRSQQGLNSLRHFPFCPGDPVAAKRPLGDFFENNTGRRLPITLRVSFLLIELVAGPKYIEPQVSQFRNLGSGQ